MQCICFPIWNRSPSYNLKPLFIKMFLSVLHIMYLMLNWWIKSPLRSESILIELIERNLLTWLLSDYKIYVLNQLLHKIFKEFSNLWVSMKIQAKTKKDNDSQQYKFKPRAFQIERIIEVDISTLGKSMGNDSFSEWKALLSEEKLTTMVVLS